MDLCHTPSILEDKIEFFFNKKIFSSIYVFCFKNKKNANLIPAAVHVDDSCRPQTVSKFTNKLFYKLIKEFYKITKVPAVLNTSFNRHGIATIGTPRHAIDHLLNGCIDILIIDDFIVYPNTKLKKITKLYFLKNTIYLLKIL